MPNTRTTAIHPGEVLWEVYMKPSAPPLTVAGLSQCIQAPRRSITDLIQGNRAVTRALAVRLGVICRTTPDYWLGLQRTYDIERRKRGGARMRRQRRANISETAAA